MSTTSEFCENVLANIAEGTDPSNMSYSQLACSIRSEVVDTSAAVDDISDGLNVFFLVVMGALVFFMQAGFAMLCAGCIRAKNVKNIMFKNLLDACGGAIGFFTLGYGFAYGDGVTFIGGSKFGLVGMSSGIDYIFFFFQFAFAATAATIVAGTVAERCKMAAYLCYSLMLTAFVYPVVVRAIWDTNGFLTAFRDDRFLGVGMIDFAGSGVVHMTGGFTALLAAIILGPRKGRFYDDDGDPLEKPTEFKPHSVALQMLGTFILWFGWYGFNPGSTLFIDTKEYGTITALCAVTTTLSAASGIVTCCFTDAILNYLATGLWEYDLSMAMNGGLGGLVGITAGTSVVTPGMAIIIGILSGWVYLGGSKALLKLKIDDAVDAIPVHFCCGLWGCIAVGLFASPEKVEIAYGTGAVGLFYSAGFSNKGALLGAQIVGILFIQAWVLLIMGPFFYGLRKLNMFRVDPLEEDVGMDISHHKGAAYDYGGAPENKVEELIERRSFHGKGDLQAPAGEKLS